jgi:hypothetical protein
MTLRLTLSGSNMALTISEADRLNSTPFNRILQPQVLNYNQGRPVAIPNTAERILIVTANMFEADLAPFVTLKQQQGFDGAVANYNVAETQPRQSIITLDPVQGAITDYVLLVGD